MKIRLKTALILGTGIATVTCVAFILSGVCFERAFGEIEQKLLRDRLRRAETLYENDVRNADSQNGSLSEFVIRKNGDTRHVQAEVRGLKIGSEEYFTVFLTSLNVGADIPAEQRQ